MGIDSILVDAVVWVAKWVFGAVEVSVPDEYARQHAATVATCEAIETSARERLIELMLGDER